MPFKLFHRKYKDELKDKSQSCIDLYRENNARVPVEPVSNKQDSQTTACSQDELKLKSKSSFNLFHKNKGSSQNKGNNRHLIVKSGKKEREFRDFWQTRANSNMQLSEKHQSKKLESDPVQQNNKVSHHVSFKTLRPIHFLQARSKSQLDLLDRKEAKPPGSIPIIQMITDDTDGGSGDDDVGIPNDRVERPQETSSRQYHNSETPNMLRTQNSIQHGIHEQHYQQTNELRIHDVPKKSLSCGSHMDNMGRDKRLNEIAQLDNYIEYLRRSTTDESNMASRLCCAQFLRISFMRLEQMHMNDMLHHSYNHDFSLNCSTPNYLSQQHNDFNQRFHRHLESLRRAPSNSVKAKEWQVSTENVSLEQGLKDLDDSPIHINCSSHETSEHDSPFCLDSDDSDSQDKLKKLKGLHELKSVPVFSPDIEIF